MKQTSTPLIPREFIYGGVGPDVVTSKLTSTSGAPQESIRVLVCRFFGNFATAVQPSDRMGSKVEVAVHDLAMHKLNLGSPPVPLT